MYTPERPLVLRVILRKYYLRQGRAPQIDEGQCFHNFPAHGRVKNFDSVTRGPPDTPRIFDQRKKKFFFSKNMVF